MRERPCKEVAKVPTNEYSFNPKVRLHSLITVEALIQDQVKEANRKTSCLKYILRCLLYSRFKDLLYRRNQPFC